MCPPLPVAGWVTGVPALWVEGQMLGVGTPQAAMQRLGVSSLKATAQPGPTTGIPGGEGLGSRSSLRAPGARCPAGAPLGPAAWLGLEPIPGHGGPAGGARPRLPDSGQGLEGTGLSDLPPGLLRPHGVGVSLCARCTRQSNAHMITAWETFRHAGLSRGAGGAGTGGIGGWAAGRGQEGRGRRPRGQGSNQGPFIAGPWPQGGADKTVAGEG